MFGEMEGLNLLMRQRQANGKERQGRYKRSDQARRVYISTVGIPMLATGKLPSNEDRRMLFTDDDKLDKAALKRWSNRYYTDPRSRHAAACAVEGDSKRQLSILQYYAANPNRLFVTENTGVCSGFRSFRIDFSHQYKGCACSCCSVLHRKDRLPEASPRGNSCSLRATVLSQLRWTR